MNSTGHKQRVEVSVRAPAQGLRAGLAAAIMIAAAMLRLYRLDDQSLWLDELYSLASSTARYPDTSPLEADRLIKPCPHFTALQTARPWWRIWTGMRQGTHPPLYIIVLRAWRQTFGGGDWSARALSAAMSLATLSLLWLIARELYGDMPALWTAAVAAVAWPQLHFAQEARPYAMLMALGAGAMLAMVRIERHGIGAARLCALGGCMLAMALTHYFCFGSLAALGLYALIRLRGRVRLLTLAAMAAAAVLFLVLWGPAMWAQRHTTRFTFLEEHSPDHAEATFWRMDELPQRFLTEYAWPIVPLVGWAAWAGLAAAAWRWRRLLLPAMWMMFTAGAIAALDLVRSTSHLVWLRYTVLASPGLYLALCGVAGEMYERRRPPFLRLLAWALAGGAVVLCAAALPQFYERQKEDWRGLGEFIRNNVGADEPLVFAVSAEHWYAMDLCIGLSHYEHNERRPVAVLTRPADGQLLDALRKAGSAWVISDNMDVRTVLGDCAVERDVRFPMLRRCPPGVKQSPAWFIRKVRWPAG